MKRKGTKVYILTSECAVIGAWSNLKKLIDILPVDNKAALYHRIYRHIQKYQSKDLEIPHFEFIDTEGKSNQIKVELIQ